MSENFPSHPVHEQQRQASMQPFIEQELHGQQLDINLAEQPLVAKDEAVATYGVNGDIIATFTLPSSSSDPGNPAREIAVVDYGEPDPADPKAVFVFEGMPIRRLGVARSRYGLAPLSYSTMQHGHISHFDLQQGSLMLGRSTEGDADRQASYLLGLNDKVVGDDMISRQHVTITLGEGTLSLTDHSTNGTLVRTHNPEGALSAEATEELHTEIGEDALEAAGVAEPFAAQTYTNEQGIVDRLPWETGASEEAEQQPAAEVSPEEPKVDQSRIYSEVVDTASRAGSADAFVLVHRINDLLSTLPENDRLSLENLTKGIVNEQGREVDRYGTLSKFDAIVATMRQRLKSNG